MTPAEEATHEPAAIATKVTQEHLPHLTANRFSWTPYYTGTESSVPEPLSLEDDGTATPPSAKPPGRLGARRRQRPQGLHSLPRHSRPFISLAGSASTLTSCTSKAQSHSVCPGAQTL